MSSSGLICPLTCNAKVQRVPDDVFPKTRKTWIVNSLGRGKQGRLDVTRHLMEVYAHPLEVYYRGTPYQFLGSPSDIVQGFLADRLGKPDYFVKWQSSGLRLRRWLRNGFVFYLKEISRERKKDLQLRELPEPGMLADPNSDPARRLQEEYEQEYVVSIVRRALDLAERQCESCKLQKHWQSFVLHHYHGMGYGEVGPQIGASPRKAKEMARAARGRFRGALRELLVHDGVPPERVDDEIRSLLQLGGS